MHLKTHIERLHTKLAKKFDCTLCGKSLTSSSSFKNHVDSIHLNIIHSCSECDFKTKEKVTLEKHRKGVHLNLTISQRQPKKCDQCNFWSKSSTQLKCHRENIHFGITYKCDFCEHVSSDKYRKNEHIKKKHLNLEKESFECPKCSKHFKSKSALNRHISTIHMGQTFPCNLCSVVRTQKGDLKKHMDKFHLVEYREEAKPCKAEPKL